MAHFLSIKNTRWGATVIVATANDAAVAGCGVVEIVTVVVENVVDGTGSAVNVVVLFDRFSADATGASFMTWVV